MIMKTKHFFTCLLLAVCFGPAGLMAQNQGEAQVSGDTVQYGPLDLWGVGLKASTDGVGFELVKGFGERINLRLGYASLNVPYSQAVQQEDIDLNAAANFKFGGVSFFVDFYPVKNVIHLTGGIMYNQMVHSITITSLSEFPFGDIMVPPEDVGFVKATLTPGTRVSPYMALGFGNTLSRQHRVSVNFELGALYYGSPQLDLTGDGIVGPLASEHNESVIMASIAQYQWFPMISFQLSFRII